MLTTSESRQQALDKLSALVTQGRQSATSVIEHVMNNQPTDRIVKGAAIQFKPDPERNGVLAEMRRSQHYAMWFGSSWTRRASQTAWTR
jgi:hypothetical protein